MAVDMHRLAGDLVAETADLRTLLTSLDEAGWRCATPAPGWTVLDQVTHLAHFDEATLRAVTEPEAFRAELQRTGTVNPDAIATGYRKRTGAEVLAWFDEARPRLIDVLVDVDPGLRMPWYGPPMSAASALTARIMETWAHGQDVADGLGVQRQPTDRLRHVAHLGVAARPFSFMVNARESPVSPVRVQLTAPGGELWTWGPEEAEDRVAGPALDFCLVVTRRRHRDDTALQICGEVADEWLTIAQAYAGSPGPGREAGCR
jgi:uncharacterized protein (TIGR03084 family)